MYARGFLMNIHLSLDVLKNSRTIKGCRSASLMPAMIFESIERITRFSNSASLDNTSFILHAF